MLRRRIFSSAMASVMALSSIAVVAQAEEKTLADYKAELETLVNGEDDLTWQCGDAWRTGELLDYGAKQTEKMLDALDTAETILENDESKSEDYAAAYYMVKGVRNSLDKKTYEDLQKLIKQANGFTGRTEDDEIGHNNILNPEINDNIYDTEWYGALIAEIDEAMTYTEKDLVPDITDAWYELKAVVDLEPSKLLPRVSKSEFRKVYLNYETIPSHVMDYETWRRNASGKTFEAAYTEALAPRDDIQAQYSILDGYKGVKETSFPEIVKQYKACGDAYNAFKPWIEGNVDATTRGSAAAVKKLMNQYNGPLVYTFMPDHLGDETTTQAPDNTTLVGAIQTALGTGTITFYADSDVNDDKGNDKLALWEVEYDKDDSDKVLKATAYATVSANVYVPVDENGKWIYGEAVLTAAPKKNDAGAWVDADGNTITLINTMGADDTAVTPNRYLALTAKSKFDLANYIKVDVANFTAGQLALDINNASGKGVDLSYAMTLADAYLNGAYSENLTEDKLNEKYPAYVALLQMDHGAEIEHPVDGDETKYDDAIDIIDEIGVLSPNDYAKGQTTEWTLVYRYLKYALEDNFKGNEGGKDGHATRADIEKMIADADALLNATGDAAIFNPTHVALFDAVKEAREWVAASYTNRDYEDGEEFKGSDGKMYPSSCAMWEGFEFDGDVLTRDCHETIDADEGAEYIETFDHYDTEYIGLNTAFTALDAEYKALMYSFEEIYKYIGEKAVAADNGELNDSAELRQALENCARDLSNIDDITYVTGADNYFDNAAFDDLREFLPLNRLITGSAAVAATEGSISQDGNPTHKALAATYQALKDAVKANTPSEGGDGEGGEGGASGTYTGNAEWSLDDASMMIADAFTGMDQTKGDYDKDGDTDLDDVSAIIRDALAGII